MGKRRKKRKSKAPAPASDVATRAYEAAQHTPLRRPPLQAGLSHDAALERASRSVLEWGRYLDENSPLAISLLDELVKSVVGRGIAVIPRPLGADGEVDDELADQLAQRWQRWARRADVTGELTYNDLCRVMCRAWGRDGEMFYQLVAGRDRGYIFDATETPFRVELLESEMVPHDYNESRAGFRQGIRHNAWGQPLQYAVYRRHPGDMGMITGGVVSAEDLKFVDATIIRHLKHARRWPATRGISLLHGVIATIYDVKDLEDAERVKNRQLANWVAAVVKSPDLIGQSQDDASGKRYSETFQGTLIDSLAPGERIEGVGPEYPVANMPEYISDQIRRVCGGTGVKYSSVARKFDGNYSSQRQELVEAVGFAEMRQDQFIADVCRPIYETWARTELMQGQVMLPRTMTLERAVNAAYRGPAIPWIDKLKEVQADREEIEAGITDLDTVRIRRGAPEHLIGQPAPTAPAPRQLTLLDSAEDDAA